MEGKIEATLLSRLSRAGAPVALALAVLLAAAPAEARRKKKKPAPPPEPAPVTAPAAPTPAEKPPPAEAKPHAAAEQAEDEVQGPSLAVVGVPLAPADARSAALAAYLSEQAARRAKKQKVLSLEDALDPDGAAARAKAAEEGKRALASAKKAYFQDLDLEVAGALCDKAYASFLKSDLPRNFNALVEADELKIASLAADPKQADHAKAELAQLLPIDPRTELSPNLFNPDFIKSAEALRQKLKDQATLTLEVHADKVPARVFVDGAFRGIAPLTVGHLAPGQHLVTVESPGYVRAQKKVNPATEGDLELQLDPASKAAAVQPKLDAIRRTFRSEQLTVNASDLARTVGVDQVLIVVPQAGPKPGSKELAAVRVTTPPPRLVDDLDAPLPADDAKAASAIDSLATQAVTQDLQLRGHRLLLASGGGKPALMYAGYGLIGGGVVAAGLGTFFGLQAKSQQSNFRSLPQTDPSAGSVASSGKTDALIANVAFGAAVVAVGTGVALVVMNHAASAPSQEAEVEPAPPPRRTAAQPARVEPKKTNPQVEAKKPAPEKKPEASKPPPEKKPESSKPPPPPEKKPEATPPPQQQKPAEATKPPEKKPAEKKPEEKKPDDQKPYDTKTKTPPKDLGEDIRDE